jgi:hypothetical protein
MSLPDRIQTEDKSFLRDTRSKALLNIDRAALERSRTARTKARRQQQTIQTLQTDVAELKALVQQLLENRGDTHPRHK